MPTIDRQKLSEAITQEKARFATTHPRSLALFEQAKSHLHDGVPMNWMVRWAGGFPIFVQEARGSHFTDVDGHDYIDFCLGECYISTRKARVPTHWKQAYYGAE